MKEYSFDFLFYDGVAPHYYETSMLKSRPLGGSESTMIKVCEGLASYDLNVGCIQERLQAPIMGQQCVYLDNTYLSKSDASVVVHMRQLSKHLVDLFPDSKHCLWMHDMDHTQLSKNADYLIENLFTVICVSRFQKKHFMANCDQLLNYKVIYNPLMPKIYDYASQNVLYNKQKLVFCSSPHKDLDYVLSVFTNLRKLSGIDFELHIFNPSYFPDKRIDNARVYNHGGLANHSMLKEISDALCVFMPMNKWQETFCIVAAEANAIGVPVIGFKHHDALDETAQEGRFLCKTEDQIIAKVIDWHNFGRPKVTGNKDFELTKVLKRWIDIFIQNGGA